MDKTVDSDKKKALETEVEKKKSKKAKKEKAVVRKAFGLIRIILLLLQIFTTGILISSLLKMQILSTKWLILIIVGLIGLFFLCALGLFLAFRAERKGSKNSKNKNRKVEENDKMSKKIRIGILATRLICIIISLVTDTGAMLAFQYTNSINNLLDKISQAMPEGITVEEKGTFDKSFIVYISGSDSHTSVDDPDARSDVNIIVVINPKDGKILLVSIPRDTYVQLHGTEGLKDKLTHAGLGIYGAEMSKQTIEDFLDIIIDYTVKVSFETVTEVVDELGGVEIFSDTALRLAVEGKRKYCNIIYGLQTIDGDCALRFSRERKSYYRGDKHRGENQQEVLTGIINKLSSSRDYVLKLPTILDIAANSFTTTFSRDEITTLIRKQLEESINWQVKSISVDGEGQYLPTYTYGENTPLYVMIADEASLADVKNQINEYLGK